MDRHVDTRLVDMRVGRSGGCLREDQFQDTERDRDEILLRMDFSLVVMTSDLSLLSSTLVIQADDCQASLSKYFAGGG